jgi:serine/threonine-protein kinase
MAETTDFKNGIVAGQLDAAAAANLTTAVFMHILTMQLRGVSISVPEAIEEVRSTYGRILNSSPVAHEKKEAETKPVEGSVEPGATVLVERTREQQPDSTAQPQTLVGRVLDGRYLIQGRIGEGGMGRVYLALQQGTSRKVAVKVISLGGENERAVKYFRQEAQALARLNHPNITQVFDAVTEGDDLYIAMEYLEGESLRQRFLRQGKFPLKETLYWLRQACDGMTAAHIAGIIHRDLKPENLMLTWPPSAPALLKILDFGLAIVDKKDAENYKTAVGQFAGTPYYMAPEQIEAKELSPACDVYSLGVIIYELLAGQNPFSSPTPQGVLMKHMSFRPPLLSETAPDIPPKFAAVIQKALEKDPRDRFTNAEEFKQALFG